MKYDIYLTQASAEAKAELARHFIMCPCCDHTGTIWLSASNVTGKITIHGAGYFDKDSLECPVEDPTPEKVCRFYVKDALAHGYTVILTPDVDEFIRLVERYYQAESTAAKGIQPMTMEAALRAMPPYSSF